MQLLDGPKRGQVDDRPDIDEERIVAWAGKNFAAVWQRADRGIGEGRIVRRRFRSDVVRRNLEVAAERCLRAGAAQAIDPGDRVELADVEAGRVEGQNRPDVVKESAGVGDLRTELKLVGDVLFSVAVVVDVDLINAGGREVVEVRAVARLLQRDVVGDDRDHGGRVRADERINISVVHGRIFGDEWCFTM